MLKYLLLLFVILPTLAFGRHDVVTFNCMDDKTSQCTLISKTKQAAVTPGRFNTILKYNITGGPNSSHTIKHTGHWEIRLSCNSDYQPVNFDYSRDSKYLRYTHGTGSQPSTDSQPNNLYIQFINWGAKKSHTVSNMSYQCIKNADNGPTIPVG